MNIEKAHEQLRAIAGALLRLEQAGVTHVIAMSADPEDRPAIHIRPADAERMNFDRYTRTRYAGNWHCSADLGDSIVKWVVLDQTADKPEVIEREPAGVTL